MYSPEEIKKAKKKVKAKKGFYQHLTTYAIINAFLVFLNLFTTPEYLWFFFPLMGWGIGLLFHYVDVFGVPGFDILNQDWEERELQNELNRNRKPAAKQIEKPKNMKPDEALELKELEKRYDDSELV